jgi:hypothetical protein
MPNRIANIIILAEDQEHQNLVRRYLLHAGHRRFRFEALPGKRGSGSQYVREQFPKPVAACRGTLGRRTGCLLIVITDADNLSTNAREKTLHTQLAVSAAAAITPTEPIIILVPKWQVETWIKCLLGQDVAEHDRNTDRPPVTGAQITDAARTLFDWARPIANVGTTCVQSLTAALPRWRRIG